ncbi:MAG: metalloregulator ArsR/SmtB family transcription factor [Anaerolineae bacterium]|nr:metalloregulator ArsR/SmtB family transcription factor [Anaerolineae bacterium]
MTYGNVIEALGDGTRRRILERLRQGACTVGELAALLPVSQPAVSQHLRVLREAGIVRAKVDGQRRIYSLAPEGLGELRDYIDRLWDEALGAFQQAAEDGYRDEAKDQKGE